MDLIDHSALTFYDSLEGEEAKRRRSGGGGMYQRKEGWQIQDPRGNGGGAARSIEINGDIVRSMVKR